VQSSRRVRILVNPSAHSGRARRTLARARLLQSPPPHVTIDVVESRSAEHFRDLVRAADEDRDLDALGLAGGDGTVALALAALGETNRVPIGALPVGSGNDFAKDIGVPRGIGGAVKTLLEGEARFVDVARVSPAHARYCCVASLGLDELALRVVHGSWLPRSKALNVYASLRGLIAYEPRHVRMTWEGGSLDDEIMFAAVTNTRSYAGGFMVSPDARVDDGKLDICVVRRSAKTRLLANFTRILKGTHGELEEVVLASSPWVRIEAGGPPIAVALDGELPVHATPLEIQCVPSALNVILPARDAARGEAA
jgi:diacylglycerol kinase (ATP)